MRGWHVRRVRHVRRLRRVRRCVRYDQEDWRQKAQAASSCTTCRHITQHLLVRPRQQAHASKHTPASTHMQAHTHTSTHTQAHTSKQTKAGTHAGTQHLGGRHPCQARSGPLLPGPRPSPPPPICFKLHLLQSARLLRLRASLRMAHKQAACRACCALPLVLKQTSTSMVVRNRAVR